MQTINIKKLLVPIDYSQTALNALDLAVAMAHRHNAEIRLLHVVQSNPDDYIWEDGNLLEGFSNSPIEKELLRLRQLAETISATHAIPCSFECRTGVAAIKLWKRLQSLTPT